MRYRTYDLRVKQMIISSGNPNLFPDLSIPRTTALYWIHKSKVEGHVSSIPESFHELKDLKKENFKFKARELFLKELVRSGFGFEFKNSLNGRIRREKIVSIVESFKDILSLSEMLTSLGISFSTFYRYRSEILGCQYTLKKCDSTFGRALSHQDQRKMIELAQNPDFAHFSTLSLCYYAQREGILSCGIDSWYKYLKMNQITRPRLERREPKYYGKGIRASKPNELWHIDVTQVKNSKFQKLYLQIIVDNYSRAILSYKVGVKKDLLLTLKSLKELSGDTESRNGYLLSDGGRENINYKVEKILLGKNITHLIAQADVSFSNSIVEAVFRQMKRIDKIRNPKSLYTFRHAVASYVADHNNRIPHSALSGATPAEALRGDQCVFKRADHHVETSNKLKCRECNHKAEKAFEKSHF